MDEKQTEREIFLAALALSPEDREAFLDGACGDDAALRQRIQDLLDAHVEPPEDDQPSRLREFRIIREIGRGGMGVVYIAYDEILKRQVALKVLLDSFTASRHTVERFHDEARLAAQLSVPGIVQIYQFGEYEGKHFISMEYVEGQTFAEWLATTPTPYPTPAASEGQDAQHRTRTKRSSGTRERYLAIARVIEQVATALHAAHMNEPPIIHRDVKPSNILVDRDGNAKIADFGIAKIMESEGLTLDGVTPGTPHYMSPEQAALTEHKIDHRSDIFSLGVVLYEALTTRRPFDGSTPHQVLHALRTYEASSVRLRNRSVPTDLATICHKALEKRPSDRYQAATQLAADLRSWQNGDPILARPPSLVRRIGRTVHRRRGVAIGVLIVLLGFAIGIPLADRKEPGSTSIVLETSQEDCVVSVTPIGSAGEPIWTERRRIRGRNLTLAPGQYRVTALREGDGATGEFNLVLPLPEQPERLVLRILDPSEAWPEHALDERIAVLQTPEAVSEDMLAVSAGEYALGFEGDTDPRLPEVVSLQGFLIDRREVTNAEYQQFIDATGHPQPYYFGKFASMKEISDLPVVWVTQEDAEAYARWRGKRLPTLMEWQASARGTDGALYPWDTDQAPSEDASSRARASQVTRDESMSDAEFAFARYAAGTRDARGPAPWDPSRGLLHMHSNVREITATVDLQGRDIVLAGRSWADSETEHTLRRYLLAPMQYGSPLSGFRCVKSIGDPGP